ncbi:putative GTP cyclohydrolase-2 [Teratosphaeria destructans]|uniref:GTP cyclohydrolase II n=1 Tax=Teratosphaeria destructans TaxID=418781 RepID=A0A9W7SP05_9PEZI|nr:putative GTP cyclohydrolase-2 [Teratosphaeria destructans]
MPDFPAHASPAFLPLAQPRPSRDRTVSQLDLDQEGAGVQEGQERANQSDDIPPLVSPALTPPRTPFPGDHRPNRLPKSIPVGSPTQSEAAAEQSKLLPKLPEVWCEVRARIPTTTGQEMFLHLYHNNVDDKEHLAIVFGPHIRSKSLDAARPGETERDRMIRGAYVGKLFPGRTSSRVEQVRREAGVSAVAPPRPSAEHLGQPNGISGRRGSQESMGEENPTEGMGPAMVRIHSECYTGETVWSARCDCGEQLDEAARLMSLPAPSAPSTPGSEVGEQHTHSFDGSKLPSCGGVIVYLRQEGRGIGLLAKLQAYNLQDLGHDTMEANLLLRHPGDARSYGLATAILLDLGLGGDRGIKLLTNNPEKVRAVEGPNREVKVVERIPMIPLAWKTGGKEGVHGPEVEKYISTKIEKFKHMFSG